jgi:serine/threonine protein kinase
MRLALEELAALPGTRADRQPYRFPYRNTCQGITVQYVDELKQASSWSPVYKATVTHISEAGGPVKVDETVAVKFIKGAYGFEAHRAMADQGLAPKIYATEPGLWTMIIMEYIEGTTLHGQAAGGLTGDTIERLTELLRALHGAGFVFGDFRLNNILVRKADGRLLLCDFDWAGLAGKTSYPRRLNLAIRWPDGVVKGGPIEAEHDLAWLTRYRAGDYNEMVPKEAERSQQRSSSSASREPSGRQPPLP